MSTKHPLNSWIMSAMLITSHYHGRARLRRAVNLSHEIEYQLDGVSPYHETRGAVAASRIPGLFVPISPKIRLIKTV